MKSLSKPLLLIVFIKLKFPKSKLIKSQLLIILLNSFSKNLGINFFSSRDLETSKELIKIDISNFILSNICSCKFLICTNCSKYFSLFSLSISFLLLLEISLLRLAKLFSLFILNSLYFSSNLLFIFTKYFFVSDSISFNVDNILKYSSPNKLFIASFDNFSLF